MSRRLTMSVALCSTVLMAACASDIDKVRGEDDKPDGQGADAAADASEPGLDTDAEEPDVGHDIDAADIIEEPLELPPAPETPGVFGIASGCYSIEAFDGSQRLAFATTTDDETRFAFTDPTGDSAARFRLRAADLGTYLLFDEREHYLVAEPANGSGDAPTGWQYAREAALDSDVTLGIDRYRSPGEWRIVASERYAGRYELINDATSTRMGFDAPVASAADAAVITLHEAEGCAEFPELPVDATGEVVPRQWDDGAVWGFVDGHSHLFTHTGFGGGGMFHGAPFHRLGVEHAVGDCSRVHGEDGRRDLIGFFYDGDAVFSVDALLPLITQAQTPEFNHHTDGYPDFIDWPNPRQSSTHQAQYYRWLERAWMSGLRLVVELATGNEVLCHFITGLGAQETFYSCNEMVGVDRQLEEVRAMERYIDAQWGGPGRGWFRIVSSPEEARAVINEGKLAVVLGIETSNLFDCTLTPRESMAPCTESSVIATLDAYRDRGVRVIFPVHKYDNAFAPGDGSSGIIELGNFINSGHYSNLVPDCPLGNAGFDGGDITFGGLNEPRDDYDAPAPNDLSRFAANPLRTLLPFLSDVQEPPIPGNFCQNTGLTPLGETLIRGMIERGMIVDIAHLPQHAVLDAFDLLTALDYPASSTHGQSYENRVYELGGFVQVGFHGCASLDTTDTMGNPLRERVAVLESFGLYPGAGFAFDLNGFARSRGPRFGDESGCPQPQPNPITYPFLSYDGEIEFQQPTLGVRTVDFNTEGMLHIGLVAELIEDVRRDGMSDEDLAPLFRSAEAWLRLWERSEARAAELRDAAAR